MTHAHKTLRLAKRGGLSLLRRSLRPTAGQIGHRNRARPGQELGGLIVVVAVVLVLSASLFIRSRQQAARSPEPSPAVGALPQIPDIRWDAKWPRLVLAGFPARSLEGIQAAYAFAARRPDVLQSLPCFCGCKRQGHAGNEACYIRSRSADNVPRWTNHAVTCDMCIDITHDAIIMTADHRPIDAIQRAIELKYQQR